MRLAVLGAGHVGLVTAAAFAEMGNEVLLADTDPTRIGQLQKGAKLPFYEPGLDELVKRNVAAHRLTFRGVPECRTDLDLVEIAFVCVGTPQASDGSADLSAVKTAVSFLVEATKHAFVIAIKSTVPPGTCRALDDATPGRVEIASCPEFLAEGTAVRDALHPSRVVIGTRKETDPIDLVALLRPFVRVDPSRLLVTDLTSAELIKYASNAHLACRISLQNEIAEIATIVGADIDEVRRGVGLDPRIGRDFLYAGIGWGGSCFGKDVAALRHVAMDEDRDLPILNSIADSNSRAWYAPTRDLCNTVLCHAQDSRRVAVWGLAFKPGTSDTRDSPGIKIADHIARYSHRGGFPEVLVHDPIARISAEAARAPLSTSGNTRAIVQVADHLEAVSGAHALVLATEWPEYRVQDWKKIAELMKPPRFVLDGRNIWDRAIIEAAGLKYRGIGR